MKNLDATRYIQETISRIYVHEGGSKFGGSIRFSFLCCILKDYLFKAIVLLYQTETKRSYKFLLIVSYLVNYSPLTQTDSVKQQNCRGVFVHRSVLL